MSIQVDGTYRDGVIHPNMPLNLPENTPVRVVVVEKDTPDVSSEPRVASTKRLTREQIVAIRPKSPKLTPEEFDAIISESSISVGSLPPDFSREDIYSDHD